MRLSSRLQRLRQTLESHSGVGFLSLGRVEAKPAEMAFECPPRRCRLILFQSDRNLKQILAVGKPPRL
jgi:hypothetical protein